MNKTVSVTVSSLRSKVSITEGEIWCHNDFLVKILSVRREKVIFFRCSKSGERIGVTEELRAAHLDFATRYKKWNQPA